MTNREKEKEMEVGPSQWSSNGISYPIYMARSVLCIVSVSSRLLKIYGKYEMMIFFDVDSLLLCCTCVASSYFTHSFYLVRQIPLTWK